MLSSDTKHNTLSLTSIPNPNPPRKEGKEKNHELIHTCMHIHTCRLVSQLKKILNFLNNNKKQLQHIIACLNSGCFCMPYADHFSFLCFLVWAHFSFVFLSHLFPSANAQHTRVCGIQSIQSSRLQQLQAGREPGHQQPGHGRRINYYSLRQTTGIDQKCLQS